MHGKKGRQFMREEKYHVLLDSYDRNIVVSALNDLRTKQIREKRPTEPVDELIGKVVHAPARKVKCACKGCREER